MCGVQCSTKLIQARHQCVGSSALPSLFRLPISVWGPVLYQVAISVWSLVLYQARVQCSIKLIQARHQHVRSSSLPSSFRFGSSALSSSFRLASMWVYQAHSDSPSVCGSCALPSSFRLWSSALLCSPGSPSVCGVQCSIKLIQAWVQCSIKLIQARHQHVGLPSSFTLAISVWGPMLYQVHSGSGPVLYYAHQARHQCVGSSALSSSFRLGSSALLSSFRLAISVWGPVLYHYQAHSGSGPVLYQAHSGSPSACGVQCSTKL